MEKNRHTREFKVSSYTDSGDITDFGGILLAVGFGGKIQKIIWTKAIQKYLFCGLLKTVFFIVVKRRSQDGNGKHVLSIRDGRLGER